MNKKNISKLALLALASVFAFLFLIPLLFLFFTSFKGLSESIGSSNLLPEVWTLENYVSVISDSANSPIFRWMGNTAVITVIATALVIVVDCLAAYSLARLNLPGKRLIIKLIILIMSIPGIVTLFPAFYLFKQAGLVNTYFPMILPYSANVTGVFLIYNFLMDFPASLEEAAYVDGASTMRVFTSIVMPSLKPIILTLGLITFLAVYNDYLWPSLMVTSNEMKTLTTGIASLVLGSNFVNPGLMMAATLLAVLPALLLFLLLNKHLVRSNLNAGIK
ncbi:MAG: carbohydrate ABC transporter permease [Candidatus Ventricola sp.]